jgi:hypothetical protein
MKKMILAGLAGLSIALASGAAMADEKLAVESTPVAVLADRPETKAILDMVLPGLTSHPSFEQFKSMTLKELQSYSSGAMTDEQLAKVQAELDALAKSAQPSR